MSDDSSLRRLMPIPFRDIDESADLGLAGYLTIEAAPGGAGYLGALFLSNARGEPVEFTYNRIEVANTFLWRPADLRRHAQRRLTASLLSAGPQTPRLLLCRANEVAGEIFTQDIALPIPVGRLSPTLQAIDYDTGEIAEVAAGEADAHLAWIPAPPAENSPERQLVDALIARGLLGEPFERAQAGLHEVYQAEFQF